MPARTSWFAVAALAITPLALSAQAAKPVKAAPAHESAAAHARAAKVPESTARATALATVPGGTVKDEELEREGGKLIYSYDIAVAGKSGIEEVHVDAMTGAVIKTEHESPAAEAREARAEKKPAPKKP